VTAGYRPALWTCVIFAALAVVTAAAITARVPRKATACAVIAATAS
jgi:hypothetical protein